MPDPNRDPVADLCDVLGEDTIRAIVARFYASIPTDPVIGPLYPDGDFAGAEQRLADFLAMRFGGSQRYAATRGHPRLRMRHAPFRIGRAERDRWVELMDAAIDAERGDAQRGDAGSRDARGDDAEPHERMRAFLGQVATFLINDPSPPASDDRRRSKGGA